jgi:molecular chaperone DnaK
MSDSLVVGIDLGTTNSLIGAVQGGQVRLFVDEQGNDLLPSVVGLDPRTGVVVGRAAKNRRLLDPEGTVASIKRKMGTAERARVGQKDLSPPQVSSLILSALLDRVETATGTRPTRAVITVPAYFDNLQREATRDAGELAGLALERLVNEPTAAAVNYQTGGEERVLVYDLGGGTFDVSVLERDAGFLEVKASRGDTHLGGDDIDRALVAWVLAQIGAEAKRTIEADLRGLTRLVEAAERAKIALSTREEVRLAEPFLAGEGEHAVHVDVTLSRADLERVAEPFIARTLACVDEALRDANLGATELDRVLLVGGSSKMPIVLRLMEDHLGRPVMLDEAADRAVARGASLLAGRFSGEAVNEVLVDITPHTLAVGAMDPIRGLVAAPVIARDTVIPTVRTRTVYTEYDDQRAATLPIVQGEHRDLEDNTWLGQLDIEEIPPSPAASPVEVRFHLDLSGVLHVDATHMPSGRSAATTISKAPTRLTAQMRSVAASEVKALRGEAQPGLAAPALAPADEKLARAMITRAERAIAGAKGASTEAVAEAERALAAVRGALEAKSVTLHDTIDALSGTLLDLVDAG